jgi:hypothetical protein
VLELSALRVISCIRSLKNAYSPTNRLHPEVLFFVFKAHPDFEVILKYFSHAWIAVNHVCRYWRNTALSSHRFGLSYTLVISPKLICAWNDPNPHPYPSISKKIVRKASSKPVCLMGRIRGLGITFKMHTNLRLVSHLIECINLSICAPTPSTVMTILSHHRYK